MSASGLKAGPQSHGLSVWSGVGLVLVGVAVLVGSVVSHVQMVRDLVAGMWIPGKISRGAVTLALLLAVVGVGMAV